MSLHFFSLSGVACVEGDLLGLETEREGEGTTSFSFPFNEIRIMDGCAGGSSAGLPRAAGEASSIAPSSNTSIVDAEDKPEFFLFEEIGAARASMSSTSSSSSGLSLFRFSGRRSFSEVERRRFSLVSFSMAMTS